MKAALIILDGFGMAPAGEGNAACAANTPVLDSLFKKYPHSLLHASGMDVGLPPGQMGNSEVGHLNIGAGRIVEMDLRRIDRAIEDGTFDTLPGVRRFVDAMRASGGTAPGFSLGLASAGAHCSTGLTKPALPALPSTMGQP